MIGIPSPSMISHSVSAIRTVGAGFFDPGGLLRPIVPSFLPEPLRHPVERRLVDELRVVDVAGVAVRDEPRRRPVVPVIRGSVQHESAVPTHTPHRLEVRREVPTKRDPVVRPLALVLGLRREEAARGRVQPEPGRQSLGRELVRLVRAAFLAHQVRRDLTHRIVQADRPHVGPPEMPAGQDGRPYLVGVPVRMFEDDVVVRPAVAVELDHAEVADRGEAATLEPSVEPTHQQLPRPTHDPSRLPKLIRRRFRPQVGPAAIGLL
jgi:hypothetical protein